jgi:hypothetical protein
MNLSSAIPWHVDPLKSSVEKRLEGCGVDVVVEMNRNRDRNHRFQNDGKKNIRRPMRS